MEQFRQGRSVVWYWRQVLGAILVGCSKELHIVWTALGVTVLWILTLSEFYGRTWILAQGQVSTLWAMQHGWALTRAFGIWSFIALNGLPVALAVGAYLGLTRVFSLRRFLRGLSAGLLTMALGVYLFHLFTMQSLLWLVHHQIFFGFVASLPVFFGLLVSMLTARQNSAERRNARSALA